MPSGDAMASGLVGAALWEAAGSGWAAAGGGLAVSALVIAERIVLGAHSPAQAVAGALMGLLLHLYAVRAPQFWLLFVEPLLVTCASTLR